MDALIGATGFVGGQLTRQHAFEAGFTSRNVDQVKDHAFDLTLCAAAPGSMFEANRFPDEDKKKIEKLISDISKVNTKRFVLISTIAVLDGFRADDEDTAKFNEASFYGKHRRDLEVFCLAHFPSCLVVRLPALFGSGLKKNFLFDIRNPMPSMLPPPRFEEMAGALADDLKAVLPAIYGWNEALGLFVIDRGALEASGRRPDFDKAVKEAEFAAELFTSPSSHFQFYDMSRLWADVALSLDAGLDVIHLAPPPVKAADIYGELTGRAMPESAARVHMEDMRTRHAALWGAENPYFETQADVLARLRRFFEAEEKAA